MEPTRLLFGIFFIVFIGNAVLKRRRLGPFDATEKFALIFSLILVVSAIFQSNRSLFSLRVACDAFIVPFIAYFSAQATAYKRGPIAQACPYHWVSRRLPHCTGLIERLTLSSLFNRVNGPFWSRNELYIIMAVVFLVTLGDSMCNVRSPEKKALSGSAQYFVSFWLQ